MLCNVCCVLSSSCPRPLPAGTSTGPLLNTELMVTTYSIFHNIPCPGVSLVMAGPGPGHCGCMRHRETGTEYESLVRHSTGDTDTSAHNNTLETCSKYRITEDRMSASLNWSFIQYLNQFNGNALSNILLIVNITSYSQWFEPLTLSALHSLVCYPRLHSNSPHQTETTKTIPRSPALGYKQIYSTTFKIVWK